MHLRGLDRLRLVISLAHAMTGNVAFKLETYARVIGSESVTVWVGYVLLCRNWGSR